jgi:hypothetical protein
MKRGQVGYAVDGMPSRKKWKGKRFWKNVFARRSYDGMWSSFVLKKKSRVWGW